MSDYPKNLPIAYNPKTGPKLMPWICPDCHATKWCVPGQPAVFIQPHNPCCPAAHEHRQAEGWAWARGFAQAARAEGMKAAIDAKLDPGAE